MLKLSDSSDASIKKSVEIATKYQVLTDKGTAYFAVIKKKNKSG